MQSAKPTVWASDGDTRTPHPQGTTTGLSQRWRHEEAAAHGLNHRWRHEDAAHHSTLALNKVRAVIELRHEEGAGRSTLTLRKVRAVIELRHVTFPPVCTIVLTPVFLPYGY